MYVDALYIKHNVEYLYVRMSCFSLVVATLLAIIYVSSSLVFMSISLHTIPSQCVHPVKP